MTRHVIYVCSRWGQPTETFVRREVAAMTDAGWRVTVLSLKPPVLHDTGAEVVHLGLANTLCGFLMGLVRHPVTIATRLSTVLRRSTRRTVLPQLTGAVAGIAAWRAIPRAHVHAHFAWVAATAAWALAAMHGTTFSVMTHAHDIFERDLIDPLLRIKLRDAAFVAAESDRLAWIVEELGGRSVEVVRMGVSRTMIRRQRAEPGGSMIVSVGSLVPKKGHDLVIRALRGVPDASLAIVGSGPEEASLKQLAAEEKVADRVQFVGAVPEDEVVGWLDRASAFVLASRVTASGDRDGVPNALIEAMARGVPVVSTTVAGIPDLIDGAGTLVEPEDLAGLADVLRELLSDREAASRLADAGLKRIEESYTLERNVLVLASLMTSVENSGRWGMTP